MDPIKPPASNEPVIEELKVKEPQPAPPPSPVPGTSTPDGKVIGADPNLKTGWKTHLISTIADGTPGAPHKLSRWHWLRNYWMVGGGALLLLAAITGVVLVAVKKPQPKNSQDSTIELQNVGNEILKSLQSSNYLGDGKQTLAITAASIFKNTATFEQDVNFRGDVNTFNVINALGGLNVTGASSFERLIARSDLEVAGSGRIQGNMEVGRQLTARSGLAVSGPSTINGDLSVTGNHSVSGALSAGTVNVTNIIVSGDTRIGHLATSGSTPSASAGVASGGGSARVSGNDTAGTVVIDTAGAGPAGILATVTFRRGFGTIPKVIMTPVGTNSGRLQIYTSRTNSFFTVGTNTPTVGGTSYAYDYIVIE